MHVRFKLIAVVTIGTAILSACGGAKDEAGEGAASTTAAASGWNATDACALLDKATLGEALGDAVTETSLGLVHEANGAEAATSECTYLLASGSRASLMARRSPIADNTDTAIAQTRSTTEQTMSAFTDKKIEDVAGLGKSAFFVPGINQMNVFLDGEKFVILTIPDPKSGAAKDVAAALVKKIGS